MRRSDGLAFRTLQIVQRFGTSGATVSAFSAAFYPHTKAHKNKHNSKGSQTLQAMTARGLLLVIDGNGQIRDRTYFLSDAGEHFLAAQLRAAREAAADRAAHHGMGLSGHEAPQGEAGEGPVGSWER